jgi:hypothetical protein
MSAVTDSTRLDHPFSSPLIVRHTVPDFPHPHLLPLADGLYHIHPSALFKNLVLQSFNSRSVIQRHARHGPFIVSFEYSLFAFMALGPPTNRTDTSDSESDYDPFTFP